MNQQDIILRIQKLLALSSSPNEHEASQAASKAQALLMQYNLSLEDVKAQSSPQSTSIEREELEAHSRKVHWKGNLAFALAKANFCKMAWNKGRMMLTGRLHNREIVKSLYSYLTTAIERLAVEGLKAEKLNYQTYLEQIKGLDTIPWSEPNWRTWKSSFIAGCAQRLCERINEQTEQIKSKGIPTANVTGLVCRQAYEREKEAIALYLHSMGITFRRKGRSRATLSTDGYSAGKRAGDSINLNRQVNPSSGARLLK
jgi:hypothetical protein